MDVSAIQSLYGNTGTAIPVASTDTSDSSFSSVLDSVMGMVGETNQLQNAASAEEMSFALGESDNTHDLLIAESKANIALQYTVAVRDKMLEAYNQIMNMQI